MRYTGILVFLSTALAACADGVSVSHNYIPQHGVPRHADYAAALGPTPVVMPNAPFPPPTVVAAMHKNNPRHHLVFTTDPPANLAGGYRVLLTFDFRPAGDLRVCQQPPVVPAAASEPPARAATRVYAAFCLGPALLSEAVATAPRLESPRDPRFSRLMGDLLAALMPQREPHEGGMSRCFPPC